jgi:transcription-repair coupling factor (superfamily II helicase)
MILTGVLDLLRETPAYRQVLRALRDGESGAPPALGVLRAARPFVLAALAEDWSAPVIYITARVDRAYNTAEQLPVWAPERPILRFAEPAALFYERSAWGDGAVRARIETLAALISDAPGEKLPLVVTSTRAWMQRTLPVQQFRKATERLRPGQRVEIEKLIARLLSAGYAPASMVVEAGQFARRGGLLDVFPPALPQPVRIELFDDEIDSLRAFDPGTQRTSARLEEALLTPAREALPGGGSQVAQHLQAWFDSLSQTDMTSPRPDRESLSTGSAFPYLETYLPYLVPAPVNLLDYAPADALIVLEDGAEVFDTAAAIEQAAISARAEKRSAGLLPDDMPAPYLDSAALQDALRDRRMLYLANAAEGESLQGALRGILAPEDRFGGQIKMLLPRLRELRASGDRTVAVTAQAVRLADLWNEQDASPAAQARDLPEAPIPRTITFVDGVLHEGWRLRTTQGDLHLLSDAEIFGWSRPEPRRRKPARKGRAAENAYADLREGDYVVHSEYGIGRFAGLRRRTLEGVEREYLLIEYAGTDAVFVPIHQADRLTRYVGPDEQPPTLNKLGQADWIRIRTRAQKAAEEEARDLLDLYASRAAVERAPYPPDTPWQMELEASFPYVETEDQLRAVHEVKADMERGQPMDRLICGDVGYGKTEVALRAAFKAVMDGRQVAVLVPTTILAQQHYENFSRRLAAFPLRVEMISRFRTPEQQRAILRQAAAGEIDILIGTHRLLADDISFRNLGLVVIDEEQRFGVRHKEHMKRLRTMVDVLTLTATPIPRTLYMSLGGVRDISMIQTPPEERLPVITHVGPFDERLVRQSVLREMERGGQVFVVHNRVQTIEHMRERLEEIVPEARVVIGHGQMDERLLERVMEEFGNGEYDILLSTSIIESGLDIPNANTLIIDRADWFGLAQLYQLRGRVGRSAQQAYAYFFHPPSQRLTEEARQRLHTLAEYTDLGAGFQIAMRDLELRGAGDILSTRQSGQIAAIGLHLYTQMLAQAVRKLRSERKPGAAALPPAPPISQSSVLIDLPLAAYLPADWLPEISMRLQIYRRIGGLSSVAEVNAMRAELVDRFGTLPSAVEGLLFQIEIKLLAHAAAATAVVRRHEHFEVRLPYLTEIDRERLEIRLGRDVSVSRTAVEIRADARQWRERLREVLNYLAMNVPVAAGM